MNPNTPRFNKLFQEWSEKHYPTVAGQAQYVSVSHDRWCKMLRGEGDCTCEPIFSSKLKPFRQGDRLDVNLFPAPPAKHN